MNGKSMLAERESAIDAREVTVVHPVRRRVGRAERIVTELFAEADIEVNGMRPCDIQVRDDRFFRRVLKDGTLGFGESYMLGWWDCDDLEELCCRAIRSGIEQRVRPAIGTMIEIVFGMVLNLQSKSRSKVVAKRHYDLGNDFFGAMLDPAMQYSCAYFHGTTDLATAQELKMELICKKLGLQPGMRLLDIGCGWGGLARFAAENHGCEVVGITISEQQKAYADRYCEGLPVDIRLQDYRDIDGEFDAICSVGMLEHVGSRNYDTYMDAASGSLRDGGLFLCHTITANEARRRPDPWISRYIFMNSELPTAAQVLQAAEGYFVNEDMHNLGPYYVPTLRAWEAGFMRSRDDFRREYGEQFVRMWRFYLLSCSGAFRARSLQVIQFLFSRGGLETPEPVRIC
jgi:cyclopropane-fatty-acyl-phospholipid synthase